MTSPLRGLTTLAVAAGLTAGIAGTAVATPETTTTEAIVAAGEHGPDPTKDSITKDGTYEYETVDVPRSEADGFGGGKIYIPKGEEGETFSGVVTIPGFLEPATVMDLYGTRLASHGFIVFVADVVTSGDQPPARAKAAAAAVEHLKGHESVSGLLEPENMALVGHSMGGGGVLEAAESLDLKGVIAVHPWAQKDFPGVNEPTLVLGGLLDNIAPVGEHAGPIYKGLTGTDQKGFLNHLTGTHWAGTSDDPAIQGRNLAFLKTMVDGDERYREFLCAPAESSTTWDTTMCN